MVRYRMKIALHVDCPPVNPTGIGRYVIELSRALVSRGARLEAWSRLSWFKASHRLFSGLEVPVLPIMSWRKYRDFILPGAYAFLRKPMVLHNPNGNLLPLLGKLPQTVMVHDLSVFLFDDIKSPNDNALWRARIEQCVKEAAGILVNSITTSNDMAEIFPEAKDKIFLTRLGVDHIDHGMKRDSLRANHILSVGTVEPRKNYGSLLKAYGILSSSRTDVPPLVIAGGNGYRAEEIIAKVRELNLTDRVRFEGYVSEGRLMELYENACCLAHPAIYEGFGFTIPEALGFDIPVVCSTSGALGELYSKVAYMVDPYDYESIANGLLKAIDYGLTVSQREAVQVLFEELTWNRCASQTEKAFKAIMS